MPYPNGLSFGPETRIVLIGTSTYADETLPPIPHALRNIDHLSRLLKDPDICGLDESFITPIRDPATIEEVTRQVARIGKEATNTFLVYYAGHGLYGDHMSPLYLATTKTIDAEKTQTGVPIQVLKEGIRTSPAKTRILILDCCYSGKALDGAMDGNPTPQKAAMPAISQEGTYGIAAVPANFKALAPPEETLTRFTGALVDVLEHGIETDEKLLTLDVVFKAVEDKVRLKGDVAPPKHANVDWASNFRVAFNRALMEPKLSDLLVAIRGIRDTLKTNGIDIESIKAKVAGIDDLGTRLTATEAALSSAIPSLTLANDVSSLPAERNPWWEYAGLEQAHWLMLPAKPYKLHIKDCVIGTRNGVWLLGAVCAASLGLITLSVSDISILPPRNALAMGFWLMYALLTVICVFLLVELARSRLVKGPLEDIDDVPKHIEELVEGNETFYDRMRTSIMHVFGFPVRRNLVSIAVIAGLFGLTAGLGIQAVKQSTRLSTQLEISPSRQ
jgi:hypothetical protein